MKKTNLIIAALFAALSFTTFVSSACANCNCPAGVCGDHDKSPQTSEEAADQSSQ